MKHLSIGIGLTGDCNYSCAHCYSSPERGQMFSFENLKRIISKGLISSLNFGTGESFLYPRFIDAIYLITEYDIKLGLTTNGTTVAILEDKCLSKFNDIDFSLDFPTPELHDPMRGRGSFVNVLKGINRCKNIGVPCSLAMCLSKQNAKYMKEMLVLANTLDVNLRINIYKGIDPRYQLSPVLFWETMIILFNHSYLISCSEPVILPLLPYKSLRSSVADDIISVRIRPDGTIMPCVYWMNPNLNITDILDFCSHSFLAKLEEYNQQSQKYLIPSECLDCKYCLSCKGGCACRRQYTNLHEKDNFCVLINKELPILNYLFIESDDLVHVNYLCTIIVRGRFEL
jgi:radical SAM protein with 4Fe4S-binding SPASM domain